ncbi:hypothetical protein [Amycolatopsis sp. VC5-11]|uniref:hypothetical protein n=1 Tax=Amycolatopsis sp. VC5-11 TaxID=3120156 RepID=UPI00300BF620
MGKWMVDARRINDRPDPQGWRSSGKQVPTFWVEAMGAINACDIAHSVLLDGNDFTRTVVTVCEENTEERITHTQTTWAPGWDQERADNGTLHASFHWYEGGFDISGNLYAEDDADEFTAFLTDGTVLANVVKTTRDRWKVAGSDHWAHWCLSTHDKRFDDPKSAAAFVALRMGAALVEGEPDDDTQD